MCGTKMILHLLQGDFANADDRNTTLYANVSDVAHMGMETFRSTGQSMELVSSLAWELAKKDGTVSCHPRNPDDTC